MEFLFYKHMPLGICTLAEILSQDSTYPVVRGSTLVWQRALSWKFWFSSSTGGVTSADITKSTMKTPKGDYELSIQGGFTGPTWGPQTLTVQFIIGLEEHGTKSERIFCSCIINLLIPCLPNAWIFIFMVFPQCALPPSGFLGDFYPHWTPVSSFCAVTFWKVRPENQLYNGTHIGACTYDINMHTYKELETPHWPMGPWEVRASQALKIIMRSFTN